MAHTLREKDKLLARIRRIQGQAAGLERLLEAESDCQEVLQQIAAIKGAINGLMYTVLEGHLVEHVVHEPDAQQREQDFEVVLQVIRSYLK